MGQNVRSDFTIFMDFDAGPIENSAIFEQLNRPLNLTIDKKTFSIFVAV